MDAFTRMDLEAAISDLAPRRNPKDDPVGALENVSGELSGITDKGLPVSELEDARCYLDDMTDDMEPDELRGIIKKASESLGRAITSLDEYGGNLTTRADDVYAAVRGLTEERTEPMDADALIAELEFRGYEVRRIERTAQPHPVRAKAPSPAIVAARALPPVTPAAPKVKRARRPRLALVPAPHEEEQPQAEEPRRVAAW